MSSPLQKDIALIESAVLSLKAAKVALARVALRERKEQRSCQMLSLYRLITELQNEHAYLSVEVEI